MSKYSNINTTGLSNAVSLAKKELSVQKNKLQNISGNLSSAVSVNVSKTVTTSIQSIISSGGSGTLSNYEKNLGILSEGIKLIEDYQKLEKEYQKMEQRSRGDRIDRQALSQLKSKMNNLESQIYNKFNSGTFRSW